MNLLGTVLLHKMGLTKIKCKIESTAIYKTWYLSSGDTLRSMGVVYQQQVDEV